MFLNLFIYFYFSYKTPDNKDPKAYVEGSDINIKEY